MKPGNAKTRRAYFIVAACCIVLLVPMVAAGQSATTEPSDWRKPACCGTDSPIAGYSGDWQSGDDLAADPATNYSIDNPNVVSVSVTGLVTALAPGHTRCVIRHK